MGAPLIRQVGRAGIKQHLGRKHEPVPDDPHPFAVAQKVTQLPEEFGLVTLQPLALCLFQFCALGLFRRHPRQRLIEVCAKRFNPHLCGGIFSLGQVQQPLQAVQLATQFAYLRVQQLLLALGLGADGFFFA